MPTSSFARTSAALLLAVISSVAVADQPGRGLTAKFERDYLEFIIDHHYAALRMTELAAGSDPFRNITLSQFEGTAPTPGTSATPARAESSALRSLARRNNRGQREEILKAQGMLKDWYGVDYQPKVRAVNQAQIDLLEQTAPGARFDHLFLEVFSRHHFTALTPSVTCQTASDIDHVALHRYCSGIVHAQLNDIAEMREMLCKTFHACDYQPVVGLKGRHSGGDGALYTER